MTQDEVMTRYAGFCEHKRLNGWPDAVDYNVIPRFVQRPLYEHAALAAKVNEAVARLAEVPHPHWLHLLGRLLGPVPADKPEWRQGREKKKQTPTEDGWIPAPAKAERTLTPSPRRERRM